MRDSVKLAGRLIVAGALWVGPASLAWAQPAAAPGKSAPTTDGSPSAQPPSAPAQPSGTSAAEPGAPNAAPPNAQQMMQNRLQQEANAVLAERFTEMAQARLRAPTVTDAMLRQAIILLDVAHQLDPNDLRYIRLQAEIAQRVNDPDRAIKVLADYRDRLKKDRNAPEDSRAAAVLMDLYVGQFQTADAKLDYLAGNANQNGIVQRQNVAPEVRSHAAEVAASILLERSQTQAMQMLDQAIQLNPLNAAALRLKYALLGANTKVPDRTAVLLASLRANPAQPAAMSELADRLGDLGLAQEANRWYTMARPLFGARGQQLPSGFVASYTTQLFLLGQPDPAAGLLAQYLVQRPLDADAWFVRLAIERTRGAQADPTAVMQARQALEQRFQQVSERIGAAHAPPAEGAGGAEVPAAPATPTTSPAQADIAKTVRDLTQPTASPEEKGAFASTVSDLAWLEVYFGDDLVQANKWIEALEKVPPPDDRTLPRLKGWLQLRKGNADQARKLLEPIAKNDALAAVGLVRLNADKKAGDAEAVRLLGEERGGMVAALLWGEFKARGLKPPPLAGDDVKAVRAQLAAFPAGILEILTAPQQFYTVRIEGFKVAHTFREPIYVKVSVQNISQYDLTLGPDGIIRPDLLLGARAVAGQQRQDMPGLAFDRLIGPLVLKSNKSITGQIIRIDQGDLLRLLDQNPGASIDIAGYAITNPITAGQTIDIGPAGQKVPFARIVRQGFNVGSAQAVGKVMQNLQAGLPGDKAAGMDLCAAYVPLLVQRAANGNPQAQQQMLQLAQSLVDAIAAKQGDPLVAGLATYHLARVHPDPLERAQFVAQMSADTEWTTRLLALEAAPVAGLNTEQQLAIAETMAKRDIQQGVPNPEGEALLRAYAAAQVDLLKNPPPAPQGQGGAPATAPATAPASGPATATAPASAPSGTQPASRPAQSQPAPAVQPSVPAPVVPTTPRPAPASGGTPAPGDASGATPKIATPAPAPAPTPAPARPADATPKK